MALLAWRWEGGAQDAPGGAAARRLYAVTLSEHIVDQTVDLRLVRRHEAIAVAIFPDLRNRLPGTVRPSSR